MWVTKLVCGGVEGHGQGNQTRSRTRICTQRCGSSAPCNHESWGHEEHCYAMGSSELLEVQSN